MRVTASPRGTGSPTNSTIIKTVSYNNQDAARRTSAYHHATTIATIPEDGDDDEDQLGLSFQDQYVAKSSVSTGEGDAVANRSSDSSEYPATVETGGPSADPLYPTSTLARVTFQVPPSADIGALGKALTVTQRNQASTASNVSHSSSASSSRSYRSGTARGTNTFRAGNRSPIVFPTKSGMYSFIPRDSRQPSPRSPSGSKQPSPRESPSGMSTAKTELPPSQASIALALDGGRPPSLPARVVQSYSRVPGLSTSSKPSSHQNSWLRHSQTSFVEQVPQRGDVFCQSLSTVLGGPPGNNSVSISNLGTPATITGESTDTRLDTIKGNYSTGAPSTHGGTPMLSSLGGTPMIPENHGVFPTGIRYY